MNVARARGKERKRKIMIETNSDNQLNYCCESCWTTSHGMHYELQHSQQQQGRVNAVSFRKKQQHINRIREFRFNFRRMYSSSAGLITKTIVVIFVLTSTTKTCDSFPIDKVVSLTERTKPPFHYLFLKPSVLKYMLSSRCLPKSCISRNVASPGTKRSALFSSSQHRDNYVEDASNKDNDDSSDIPALNMHHQRHNHHHVTASRRHLPEMEKDELKALQVTDESHHSSSPSSSDILPNLGHRGHRQTSGSLHYSVQQDQQRFGSDRSQHNDNDNPKEHFLIQLKHDNERLQRLVNDLEDENRWLHHEISNKIVLEQFEGEGNTIMDATSPYSDNVTNNMWCDELEGGQCPIEPALSFGEALRDRAYWLVGLLILQSCSGIILARNEALLTNHPFIIYFLTMLIGAGGNAGNQASVRVIRGLALGTLNEKTQNQFLFRELKMAGSLSLILSLAGFIRAAAFHTPFAETIAVTISLFFIVLSSVCLGAILPLLLKKIRVDPAHSSTTIQVVMDILGVVLSVAVSSLLLDSPIGKSIITKLSDGGA